MVNLNHNEVFETKCKEAYEKVKNLKKKTKELICIGLTVAMLGAFVVGDIGNAVAYASGVGEGVPHVIKVGEKEIAVLQSKSDAELVLENIKREYGAESTESAAIITPMVSIEEKEYVTAQDVEIKSVTDATSDILDQNATDNPYFEITVSQPMVMTEIIQHDTKVVKTDKLEKGEKKVSKKGKNGEKTVIGRQTVVNGEIVSTEVYSEEVVSKPVTEVIKKGTKEKEEEKEETSTSVSSSSSSSASSSTSYSTNVSYNPSVSAGVVGYAQAFHGVPYVYGGSTPAGFDCSGFTMYVYRAFGINLPHSANAQAGYGVAVSAADARPGDLVWMPGHVGIYAGNGMMVHAPVPGRSVVTEKIWGACTFRRLV